MNVSIVWSKGSGQGVTVEVGQVGDYTPAEIALGRGGSGSSFTIYETIDGSLKAIFDDFPDKAAAIAAARDYLAGRPVRAHRVGVGIIENSPYRYPANWPGDDAGKPYPESVQRRLRERDGR